MQTKQVTKQSLQPMPEWGSMMRRPGYVSFGSLSSCLLVTQHLPTHYLERIYADQSFIRMVLIPCIKNHKNPNYPPIRTTMQTMTLS